MKNINSTILFRYKTFGHENMAAITPVNVRYFSEEGSEKAGVRGTFALTQVIDEEIFLSEITDRSGLFKLLITWVVVLTGVFIFII